ncbi:MAG TPA: kelch repeat-containing protein [Chthoniobacterales bacterium]
MQKKTALFSSREWITICCLGSVLCAVQPAVAGPERFIRAGHLVTPRLDQQAVMLPDGSVLLAGGQDRNAQATSNAELFDPATKSWSPAANMGSVRRSFTATLLSNGMVLVAGGGEYPPFNPTAQLYDPTTDTWTLTGNPIVAKRAGATATLLPNGKVLLAGGTDATKDLGSAELYDPATGTWSQTGSLIEARAFHTATLLPNGDVLMVAGLTQLLVATTSAEVYHTATGQWAAVGSLTDPRFLHSATRLMDGRVLVAGGAYLDAQFQTVILASAEVFDPDTGNWSSTGSLSEARVLHTTTLLAAGRVLAAGGAGNDQNSLASAEVYEPATGTWTTLPAQLHTPRHGHSALRLRDGSVLIAAGVDHTETGGDTYLGTAEEFVRR